MEPLAGWREQAACAGHDPRMWDVDHPDLWDDATIICRRCPVAAACLAEHHGNLAAHGVFAGVPLERGQPVDPAHRRKQVQRLRSMERKRALLLTVNRERWPDFDDVLRELA